MSETGFHWDGNVIWQSTVEEEGLAEFLYHRVGNCLELLYGLQRGIIWFNNRIYTEQFPVLCVYSVPQLPSCGTLCGATLIKLIKVCGSTDGGISVLLQVFQWQHVWVSGWVVILLVHSRCSSKTASCQSQKSSNLLLKSQPRPSQRTCLYHSNWILLLVIRRAGKRWLTQQI